MAAEALKLHKSWYLWYKWVHLSGEGTSIRRALPTLASLFQQLQNISPLFYCSLPSVYCSHSLTTVYPQGYSEGLLHPSYKTMSKLHGSPNRILVSNSQWGSGRLMLSNTDACCMWHPCGSTDHMHFLTEKSQHSGVPWPGFFQKAGALGDAKSLVSLCPLGKQGSQGNHYWYWLKDGGQQVHRTGSEVTPGILTTLSRPPREDHTTALLMRQPGTAQCAQHREQGDVILEKRGETQTKCGRYKIVLVELNPASQSLVGAIPCSCLWYLQNSSSFKSLIAIVSLSLSEKFKLQIFLLVLIYMEGVT